MIMNTKIILKTILITFLIAGITEAPLAQQRPDRDIRKQRIEKVREMRQERSLHRLPNLTDTQKEQINEIMLQSRQEVLPLQNQVHEKMVRLQTLRTAADVDMDAINTVIDEIGDFRTQIIKRRLLSEQDIRKLLTEEQRVIFDSRGMPDKHRGPRFRKG